RLFEISFGLAQIGDRLIQSRLILTSIDGEHEVAGFDNGTFLIVPRSQIALDTRANLGVDISNRCPDPFGVDGHILLYYVGDKDLGRSRGSNRLSLLSATHGDTHDSKDNG